MTYLSAHKIIHRDLATRNVLMRNYYHIQITDFGLAAIFTDDTKNIRRLPFRWVPMECLKDHSNQLYGEPTDVWSFGVTCWEILTYASLPYGELKSEGTNVLDALYEFLSKGNRLARPENCGLELYKTLLICKSFLVVKRKF